VNVCQCNKCIAESDVYRRRSLLGRLVKKRDGNEEGKKGREGMKERGKE
jgi:hypothetical protein